LRTTTWSAKDEDDKEDEDDNEDEALVT